MDGQIVLVNILPSTYTPQTELDRGDKPQAGIRHVTTRRNSMPCGRPRWLILPKIYLDTIAPSTLSGAGVSSSFHRNDRPNCRQAVGEGLGHLDVGSLWNVDMPVGGAAVGIMIGGAAVSLW